jgi:RND superfamily putative drug exporter
MPVLDLQASKNTSALAKNKDDHPAILARLGRWTAIHFWRVLIGWAVVLILFGAFAPKVETALAGAGWDNSSSQSVAARNIIQKDFSGLGSSALQVVIVDHHGAIATDRKAQLVVAKVGSVLRSDKYVSKVVMPQAGSTISQNGTTVVITGGAAVGPNAMVNAASKLQSTLDKLSTRSLSVELTGDSALWSQFNSANHSAMMRSEILSWPVTLLILVVVFGSLVAAGLPLMLTVAGLLVAAGALVLATKIGPVSIWALNFALMFALALGIDYALFLVVRFRSALKRRNIMSGDSDGVVSAVAETMNTAGKAVAFSAVTVLLSLSSVLVIPSPAFRSMALGIMLSVVAVLAATLTLLPAVLGRLGTKINSGKLRIPGRVVREAPPLTALERQLHRWGKTMWSHPYIVAAGALIIAGLTIVPVFGLKTSMPSIKIIPASASARIGYNQISSAFGPGVPSTLQVLVPAKEQTVAVKAMRNISGVADVMPMTQSGGYRLDTVVPTTGPSTAATQSTIAQLRQHLPAGSLVGGAAAENYDLQRVLSSRTPLVFGLLLLIGFVSLVVALGAPLLALAGIAVTGLSVAGAFGVARLIFQNGDLSGILNFAPQGFVDAWGPIFFGAMVAGVAMDYTLFLLSAAKEHYENHSDTKGAMVTSIRSSGRVVVSAAAVMIAVFLTFALSGPLAPKEMGVILAIAVALDSVLVRMALLPVLLRLGGHRIWDQPAWLGKILPNIRFSH